VLISGAADDHAGAGMEINSWFCFVAITFTGAVRDDRAGTIPAKPTIGVLKSLHAAATFLRSCALFFWRRIPTPRQLQPV